MTERKDERVIKAFVAIMSVLIIIVAAVTVGSYNGYDPDPSSVSITGFLLIITLVITAVWYRSKYTGYSNRGKED
ncbi:MAG: hypothetical protein QXH07_06220 [Thermoplasmata archaeon]